MEDDNSLKHRWDVLDGRKGNLHTRSEKYSMWTLPYLYPKENQKDTELDTDLNSIGARAVNHLSNRLINTLFPSTRSFMRLSLSATALAEITAAQVPMQEVDKALVAGERKVMRELDKIGHRTAATQAGKLLIVTGNALMYYPLKGKAQVYNTRDYSLLRDLSGELIELITRDQKAFETFTDDVQDKLRASDDKQKYADGSNVTLYTRIKLDAESGKFEVTQAADMIDLDIPKNEYSKKDMPWIPLAWNLVRGEDYGRGMVEDYRGMFNALVVLAQALLEGIISAAAVKFLVSPASVVDVEKMNASPNGSYHSGRDGDIVTLKSDKHLDFQQVRVVIQDYERQLSQVFLLGSSTTRDAERVTAEEIREDARELETSFGGLYSRFTEDWQEPVAQLMLSRQDIKINEDTVFPVIVTGLDTLSRLGDIDNYRMFTDDLALVNSLPEAMQVWLKVPDLISWVGNNRGVDYSKFIKTTEEVATEQQAAIAQEQKLMQAETGNQLVADAGKEIAKQEL